MHLDDQVALVTGASRGIGRAIALTLAKAGAHVAVNYAGNAKAAEEVVNQIQALGRKAILVQGDVSKADVVDAMIKQVTENLGPIDILVNNAGITRDTLLMRMKEEDWDAVLNTNLKGIYLCTKAVTKGMMKRKSGKIVNMTSVIGVIGNAGQSNYAAAKAGVIGFTKSMAKELGSRNITVNAIAPGFIDTDMTSQLPEQVRSSMEGSIPLGRLGLPEDIAKAVLFLVSPEAAYITGQVLHVDGGMVM